MVEHSACTIIVSEKIYCGKPRVRALISREKKLSCSCDLVLQDKELNLTFGFPVSFLRQSMFLRSQAIAKENPHILRIFMLSPRGLRTGLESSVKSICMRGAFKVFRAHHTELTVAKALELLDF